MPEAALNIRPEELAIVQGILRRIVPGLAVRAFGSRVTGRAKPHSDLDLALMTDAPLGLAKMAELAEAFSESNLPWKVDLVDWAAIDENFRRVIEKKWVDVQGR